MAVVSGKKKAVFPAAVEWLLHPQTGQAVEMDLLPKQRQYHLSGSKLGLHRFAAVRNQRGRIPKSEAKRS